MFARLDSICQRSIAVLCTTAALLMPGISRAQTKAAYDPPLYNDGKFHSEITDEKIGPFTVTRRVEDYRAQPIMHGPWLNKSATLEWRDSSGNIGFSYIDDGYSWYFQPHAQSADGKTICITAPDFVPFNPRPTTTEGWKKTMPAIVQRIRSCEAVVPADLNRAFAELSDLASSYVQATSAWKAVSAELFGTPSVRCVKRKYFTTMQGRSSRCTKYSKP